MNRLYHTLIIFTIAFSCNAQNTWIQRLNFADASPYQNTDSLTGIRDIQISADGNLLVLAFTNQDCSQNIYKISPSGAQILWSVSAGVHGGITGEYTRNIYPTSDSGMIVSDNPWGESISFSTYGTVKKYSKNGILEWSYGFNPHTNGNQPYYDCSVHDVIQNMAGNYYATVGDRYTDTLYEFNHSGNIIYRTDTIKGYQIYEMQNGNLLVQSFNNNLERRDTSGMLYWSVPSLRVLSFTPAHTFIISSSGIQKVDNATGSIAWSKSYPFGISSAIATRDGGFISSSGLIPQAWFDNYANPVISGNPLPATLCRVDSSGDTLWTKTYDFPHYGLSCVSQLPSGNIITGGTFLFTNARHEFYHRDYSAFVTSLDSLGNGPLQTTTLTWPGDANYNQLVSFVDDAPYVGIANGMTGPARDTLSTGFPDYEPCSHSNYATDWPTSFANGTNHKHADYNGDGIIDTSDISPYSNAYYLPLTVPQWRFGISTDQNVTSPEFVLKPEHDTVFAGDSIRFYIVAGNNSTTIDSLYAIAFSALYNMFLVSDSVKLNFLLNGFGTPGIDLLNYGFVSPYYPNISMMACRTNRQDAFSLSNDTLGVIIMVSVNTITSPQLLNLHINEFNALTFGQASVSFNVIDGNVLILPGPLSAGDNTRYHAEFSPNPASEILYLKSLPDGMKKISILNSLGAVVKEFESSEKQLQIIVDDLPPGVYTLGVQSDKAISNSTFVVQH